MAEEAGEENFFLFGLTAEQVASSHSSYNPHWHYDHAPETRTALDLIFADHFSRCEPGVFAPWHNALLTGGDHYMHLADLKSYLEADRRLVELWPTRILGSPGHTEYRGVWDFLQRPHYRRVCGPHLERQALPSGLVDCKFFGEQTMEVSPLAGKPADPSILIDVYQVGGCLLHRATRSIRARAARRVRNLRASRLLARQLVQRSAYPRDNPGDLSLPQTAGHRRPALHRFRYARALSPGFQKCALLSEAHEIVNKALEVKS